MKILRANETGMLKSRCLYFVQKSGVGFGYRNRRRRWAFESPLNVNADGAGALKTADLVSRFGASHGFDAIQRALAAKRTAVKHFFVATFARRW